MLTLSLPDSCIEWPGSRNDRNYGRRWIDGRYHLAHRLVWEVVNGAIEGGLFVLHHCDNPPCINPRHLFLGTQRNNLDDMVAKGRHPGRGSWARCIRGHEMTKENTIWRIDRGRKIRRCATCQRDEYDRRNERRRQERNSV